MQRVIGLVFRFLSGLGTIFFGFWGSIFEEKFGDIFTGSIVVE